MRLAPIEGVPWYLSGDAPERAGSCAPSDESDDAATSLSAFYDDFLSLYDRDTADGPRDACLQPAARVSTTPAGYSEPWAAATAIAISQDLRKARPALRARCAGLSHDPLSTIYSFRHPLSSSSLASAPPLPNAPLSAWDAASGFSAPSLHRGLTTPAQYEWPAYLGDDGRARLKGSVHVAAKGCGKADLQKLIIDQPLRLAEREASSGRTPLACAVRKQRFKEAEMILSAMQAYGHVANHVVNYVGYDGRNALLLVMDASIHHIAALGFFDALLQAGANPLWPCPVMQAPGLLGLRPVGKDDDIQSEHAAQYAVRTGKSLWLNKLLRWDEAQRRQGKTNSYRFDVSALRTQASACKPLAETELGRVLWAAEQRRYGQGLRHAHGVSLDAEPLGDVALGPG